MPFDLFGAINQALGRRRKTLRPLVTEPEPPVRKKGLIDPQAVRRLRSVLGLKEPEPLRPLARGDIYIRPSDRLLKAQPIGEVKAATAPAPTPTTIPMPEAGGSREETLREFLRMQAPHSTLEEWYPAYKLYSKFQEAEERFGREGLSTLLTLIAFFESTLGRAGPNLFGVLPPGRGGPRSFEKALEYQLGPEVLSGGANPNMNILSGKSGPITSEEIKQLMSSYNPPGAYLQELLDVYGRVEGR